jgi:N-succinyldiaminopimelate aminotransferase
LNPLLQSLQAYPFERLRSLLSDVVPNPGLAPINLSIGEPKHPTPAIITDTLIQSLSGLSSYPATAGSDVLVTAIARWLENRYQLVGIEPRKHVLPVLGSREALFSLAQVVIDPSKTQHGLPPVVLSPNPFYQIYEGAALLAGAQVVYLNQDPSAGFAVDWQGIEQSTLERTQLLFVCSPGNPTGRVMDLAEWQQVFQLADQYGFVIASDECYSEIWQQRPPLGVLQAAQQLGRSFERLIMFTSLSKRSNAPGLRSGFVAGDPNLIKSFLLYRTYHGSAMSMPVQMCSAAAWSDETHVEQNRALYRSKFAATHPILSQAVELARPDAGFYYWFAVPKQFASDEVFVSELLRDQNVLALPGSYLSRTTVQGNPGAGFVRLALVEPEQACLNGIHRICQFIETHHEQPAKHH